MEILWWLAPAVVTTVLAMCWVTWVGRDSYGEIDRDEAVERISRALRTPPKGSYRPRSQPVRDRSTGIAVRPSRSRGESAQTTRRSA